LALFAPLAQVEVRLRQGGKWYRATVLRVSPEQAVAQVTQRLCLTIAAC